MTFLSQQKLWWIFGLMAATAEFLVSAAVAQDYPARPIRVVVAATTGGGPDTVMRLVGPKLSAISKQSVIIDNRSGAGGNLGTEIVAKSAPDGYTLLVSVPTLTTSPGLYRQLGYDVFRDFASVTLLTTQSYLLVVHPSVPAKNLQDLMGLARTKKGSLSYASTGVGQLAHLGVELLLSMGKFEALHVPYKGASAAILDVLSGRVDMFMVTPASSRGHVQAGKLRAIAATGEKRSLTFPEIPTVAEQGLRDYKVDGWYGLHAPSGTPPKVIAFLQEKVLEIFRMRDVDDGLKAIGAQAIGSTPAELDAFLKTDYDKWSVLIKKLGITPE